MNVQRVDRGVVVAEICNFKHGCIYKNARRHQLAAYMGAVQAVWRHYGGIIYGD